MIINGLKANQFMRFEQFELKELPDQGIIGIFGDNECGKSTFGELICFCLFGKTPKSHSGEPGKIIRWGQDTCTTEINVTIGKNTFRIMRRISADGTRDGRMIMASDNTVIASSYDDIEQAVVERLGFSFKEFRYSMFIAQKELDIILRSEEDRKLVLNNMLGVGFMEKIAAKVAGRRTKKEQDVSLIHSRLDDKIEIMEVYEARERDMSRLDKQFDETNGQLIRVLRERDVTKSTISMLEDIRRKSEQFEVLNVRISNRREQLKQIETDCSNLMRDSDRIPSLKRENDEKSALIEDLNENRLSEIRDRFKKLDEYRDLNLKRDQIASQLDLKESALSDITDKLDRINGIEEQIRELDATRSSIDFFIQSFSGEDRFQKMSSRLVKDIELIETEIHRSRESTESDLNKTIEQEESFKNQLKKIQKQIEAATIDNIDPDRLMRLQKSDRANSRVRDISFGFGAACLIAGVVLTLVTGNTILLSILLGIIPAIAVAIAFQSRIRHVRADLEEMQRQSYAYNITQRGVLELRDTIDDVEKRLDELKERHSNLKSTIDKFEKMSFSSFPDIEKSIEFLRSGEIAELERANGLMMDVLDRYSDLRSLVDDTKSFEEILKIDPEEILGEKEQEREKLENEINRLREKVVPKDQLSEQSETLLRSISSVRTEIAKLDHEMNSLGVTDEDEPRIKLEEKEVMLEIEQLGREIEHNNHEIRRIEAQTNEASDLEERRRTIIHEIDEDLIKFYELKEATHDIDCSSERFENLKSRLTELEEEALEIRGEIKEIEAEKRVVQKDLDKIPDIRDDVDAIKSEISEKETSLLKLRELEHIFIQTGLDIKKRLVPQIESYFGWVLPKMTRGRYHKVKLNDNFDIQIYSDENNGYVDIDALSGGTVDQLLISLRLAFARAATAQSESTRQFLFLDEPFSSFDESRRVLFFKLLETLKSNFQQIFLISHLPELEDYVDHYIQVDLSTEQPVVTSWI
ncbi:MAG TPA: SMC family ATPase [bacterium]|nr:SMC family ATPase [bacterium]